MLLLALGLFPSVMLGGAIGAALSRPDQEWLRFLVATLSFHGAILAWVAVLLKAQGLRWADTFGLRQGRLTRALGLGVTAALLALPMAWALSWASAETMRRALFVEPTPQQAVTSLRSTTGLVQQCSMGFMAVVLAPMAEEVLFRGLLYAVVRQRTSPWFAAVSTSFAFGAIHGNLMTLLPLTVFSLVLVWLYEETGNLATPVIAHSMFNLANLVLLLGVG